jgi:hypothetical protein
MSIAVEHGRFQLTANSKRGRILSATTDKRKRQLAGAIPAGGNS